MLNFFIFVFTRWNIKAFSDYWRVQNLSSKFIFSTKIRSTSPLSVWFNILYSVSSCSPLEDSKHERGRLSRQLSPFIESNSTHVGSVEVLCRTSLILAMEWKDWSHGQNSRSAKQWCRCYIVYVLMSVWLGSLLQLPRPKCLGPCTFGVESACPKFEFPYERVLDGRVVGQVQGLWPWWYLDWWFL